METLQIVIIGLMLFVCIYSIVYRICQCIEHCATAKAYGMACIGGLKTSIDSINKEIKNAHNAHNHNKDREM